MLAKYEAKECVVAHSLFFIFIEIMLKEVIDVVEAVIRCIVSWQILGGIIGSFIGIGVVCVISNKLSD